MVGWRYGWLLLLLTGCSANPTPPTDPQRLATIQAELGGRYLAQGEYALAQLKLQKAIAQAPHHPLAHHYLGELYRRLQRPALAADHYRQALDGAPNDNALRNNYGVFLCEQQRYSEAEEQFLRVLQDPLYPLPQRVYENLAVCANRAGDTTAAERWYRQAEQIRLNRQSITP